MTFVAHATLEGKALQSSRFCILTWLSLPIRCCNYVRGTPISPHSAARPPLPFSSSLFYSTTPSSFLTPVPQNKPPILSDAAFTASATLETPFHFPNLTQISAVSTLTPSATSSASQLSIPTTVLKFTTRGNNRRDGQFGEDMGEGIEEGRCDVRRWCVICGVV